MSVWLSGEVVGSGGMFCLPPFGRDVLFALWICAHLLLQCPGSPSTFSYAIPTPTFAYHDAIPNPCSQFEWLNFDILVQFEFGTCWSMYDCVG